MAKTKQCDPPNCPLALDVDLKYMKEKIDEISDNVVVIRGQQLKDYKEFKEDLKNDRDQYYATFARKTETADKCAVFDKRLNMIEGNIKRAALIIIGAFLTSVINLVWK